MSAPAHDAPVPTEELFREHAPFVTRFLMRLGVPAAHVDDLVQEVFLVVCRHGGYRPGPAKPTSYLARVAIQAAASYRRRDRAQRNRWSERLPDYVASTDDDPEQALEMQRDWVRLRLALDDLPEKLRTTLLLVDLEGESSTSVAAAFGLPVGTIYWRLHEARKRLKSTLSSVSGAATPRQPPANDSTQTGLRGALVSVGGLFVFALFGSGAAFKRSEAGRVLGWARERWQNGFSTASSHSR